MVEQLELYSLPLFGVLLIADFGLRWTGTARAYALNDSLCSVAMGLAYAAMSALVRTSALLALAAVHSIAPFRFALDAGAMTWVGAYLAVDLAFYWFHRTIHEVRIGWAAHVNHHSSQHYNYATALRQSVVEPILEPFFMAPVVLLGFHPIMVLTCLAANFIYQFWPHTEIVGALRPLGAILVTPSHHRVHHATNVQYLDKNYGGTFIVWDKLFGTFEPEVEQPTFGITHQLDTHNPVRATFHEWIAIAGDLSRAGTAREVLGYLLRPPGWSPNGPGQTSRERQARALGER